jgi:hypothetical protein
MENPYFSYLLDSLQHEATQHTMAPPPSLTSTLHQPAPANQNHTVNYAGRGLASSSNIYSDSVGHLLQPSGHPFPLASPPSGLDLGNPSGSSVRHIRSSAHPQKPLGRTTAITPDAWTRHKSVIHKLWIEEDKPLPETMAIMAEKYHFQAS